MQVSIYSFSSIIYVVSYSLPMTLSQTFLSSFLHHPYPVSFQPPLLFMCAPPTDPSFGSSSRSSCPPRNQGRASPWNWLQTDESVWPPWSRSLHLRLGKTWWCQLAGQRRCRWWDRGEPGIRCSLRCARHGSRIRPSPHPMTGHSLPAHSGHP